MGRPTAQTAQAVNRTNPVPRWVAPAFALAALCTLPWVVFLAASLPATSRVNDRLAWVGFDVGEVVMLMVTAYLAWRGKPKVALAATALATMLVVDAWFDVNTSTPGAERHLALAFAVLEVSLAAVSLWIAFHAASVGRRRVDDLADWARERPGPLADAVARSGDAVGSNARNTNGPTGPDVIRRSRSRKARGHANRAARAPRTRRAASDARLRARKHIRRHVPDERHPAAADAAD
jgi:hypothetical protein